MKAGAVVVVPLFSMPGLKRMCLSRPRSRITTSAFLPEMCIARAVIGAPMPTASAPATSLSATFGVNSSGLDARRGISLVIANTAKAEELIPYIKSETSWAERPLEEAVRGNGQLMHPTPRPVSRDVVLERWKEEGIGVLEGEYRRSTLLSSKEWLAKRAVKKFLKGVLGR